MPHAKDVILKHIAAVNDRDSDAEPWAADAELVAPGGQASGRDNIIGFLGVFHEAFPDLRPSSSGGRLSISPTATRWSPIKFFDQMDFLGQVGLLPD